MHRPSTRLTLLALAALALVCALAPAGASAKVTPKVVHGTDAAITDFPFQVALFEPAFGPPAASQFCGGVIVDATHVITAAHCLFDFSEPNQVSNPAEVEVLAGTADLSTGGTLAPVSKTSFDPQYDPNTNDFDVGVITLASPLWTGPDPTLGGGTPPSIAPVPIVPADETAFTARLTAHENAIVTGWGDQNPEPPGPQDLATLLQKATVPLVDDTTCGNDYTGNAPITPRMFCAGDHDEGTGITDSCQGDSGGPIVVGGSDPANFVLAGLVDSGEGCAQAGFPGIYDRLSNADLHAFVTSDPVQAPEPLTDTTVSGGNQPGQTLTCTPSQWSDGTVTVQFINSSGTELTPLTPDGTTYTIQPADLGSSIECQTKSINTGGYGFARSRPVFIPHPIVPPPPPPPPPPARDSVAPKLHVSSKKCSKTSCTVKVKVTDAAPSSGISKVKATLSYTRRVKCKGHKSGTCTKRAHRSLRAKAGAKGVFTIVAAHLRPGTGYTITLLPFDRAGNKPQFSTITSIRTKKKHPFFLF